MTKAKAIQTRYHKVKVDGDINFKIIVAAPSLNEAMTKVMSLVADRCGEDDYFYFKINVSPTEFNDGVMELDD